LDFVSIYSFQIVEFVSSILSCQDFPGILSKLEQPKYVGSTLANLILTERLAKGLILPAIQDEEHDKIRSVGLEFLDMVIVKIKEGMKSVKPEHKKLAIFKMVDRMPSPKILTAVWNLETGSISEETQNLSNLQTLLRITSFLVKNFRKKYTTQLDLQTIMSSIKDLEVDSVAILEERESLSQEQNLDLEANVNRLNESKADQAEGELEFRTEEEIEKQWKILSKKLKQTEKEKTAKDKEIGMRKEVKHLTDFLSHVTRALALAPKDGAEEKKLAEICESDFEKALAKDAHTILAGR
jgi:hypothetical protein